MSGAKVSGLLWILVFFACALFKIVSSIKQKSVPSFNKWPVSIQPQCKSSVFIITVTKFRFAGSL